MTRTLVIGGCGFIGSHIVDSLLARGHCVRVVDMKPEAFRAPLSGVDYVRGSFADRDVLAKALRDVDAVIHTASTTVPATSNQDPVADIQGNLISTVNLLQEMRTSRVRKLVFLSSGGTVYGIPKCEVVDETHPLAPISSYGILKVAIENYLHMESKLHGLDYVALRASNPYGPRQGHTGLQGIIGTYLWKTAKGEPIEVWGDGSVVRDFIDVRDLAELTSIARESSIKGCFNAGSGKGASVNRIVQLTSQITGRDLRPVYKPGRGFDVPRIVLDISRIRHAVNWFPRISLDQGMSESWDWMLRSKQVSAVA